MIPLRFKVIVFIYLISFPDDKDFLFYPFAQANLTLFAYFINNEITKVLVKNTSDQFL